MHKRGFGLYTALFITWDRGRTCKISISPRVSVKWTHGPLLHSIYWSELSLAPLDHINEVLEAYFHLASTTSNLFERSSRYWLVWVGVRHVLLSFRCPVSPTQCTPQYKIDQTLQKGTRTLRKHSWWRQSISGPSKKQRNWCWNFEVYIDGPRDHGHIWLVIISILRGRCQWQSTNRCRLKWHRGHSKTQPLYPVLDCISIGWVFLLYPETRAIMKRFYYMCELEWIDYGYADAGHICDLTWKLTVFFFGSRSKTRSDKLLEVKRILRNWYVRLFIWSR